MSRIARRTAVSLGTAAGAALIAASFSLGNAPVAGADVTGAEAVGDVIGSADVHALAAAGVSNTMALSYLIEAFDPSAFSSTGAPTDPLGLIGYYGDTYLLGPSGLDTTLAPLVQELVGSISTGTPGTYTPEISELVFFLDPQAFAGTVLTNVTTPTDVFGELAYGLDNYFLGPFGLEPLFASYVQDIISSPAGGGGASVDVSLFSDLLAALEPSAFAADATAPALDGLLSSGLSLF